jgi:hypothetical protein
VLLISYVRVFFVVAVAWLPAAGIALSWGSVMTLIGVIAMAMVIGWPSLLGLPQRNTGRAVLLVAGGIALTLAFVWQLDDAAPRAVLLSLGVSFPAAFCRELLRPAPREGLLRSVTGTTAGAVAVALTALWVPVARAPQAQTLALVSALAITGGAVGLVAERWLPRRKWTPQAATLIAALLGGCGGVGAALWGTEINWWVGAILAALIAAAFALAHPIFAERLPKWLALADLAVMAAPTAAAALPLWAAALIL